MPGDAEATKERLLEAATSEFAACGLAGAGVDRIAAAAGSNKARPTTEHVVVTAAIARIREAWEVAAAASRALERLGSEAPGRRCVPDPEREACRAESGGDGAERRAGGA